MPIVRFVRFLPVLAGIALVGCGGGGDDAPDTAFASATPINGKQPALATSAFYGSATMDTDFDGIADASALMVLASDNPNLCGSMPGDLREFLLDTVDGKNTGFLSELVVLTAVDLTSAVLPQEGTLQGDGVDVLVHGGFFVTEGSLVAANTFTNRSALIDGAGDGALRLSSFGPQVATGRYTGRQTVESATGTNVAIDEELTGTFTAEQCTGISFGLEQALGSMM